MNKTLNLESLLVRLGNDIELTNEILNLFIDTIPEQMDILRSAVERKDSELIRQIAHLLKGSAGNISAEKLAKTASILEIAGESGNLQDSASGYLLLQEEYKELQLLIMQELKSI